MAILRATEEVLFRRSTSRLLGRQSSGGSGSTDPTSDDRSYKNQPFTWIFIPLLGLLVTGVVLSMVFRRRRRRLREQMGLSNEPRHQGEVERHLNGYYQARGPRYHGYMQGNGWQQWTGTPSGLRGGRGLRQPRQPRQPRAEEGLNELGEAPPPYEGRKSMDRGDSMEMHEVDLRRPDPAAFPGRAEPSPLPDYATAQRLSVANPSTTTTEPSSTHLNANVPIAPHPSETVVRQ